MVRIADSWLPFVELGGTQPGPEQTQQGEQLILRILRPYLIDKALAELGEADDTSAGTQEYQQSSEWS